VRRGGLPRPIREVRRYYVQVHGLERETTWSVSACHHYIVLSLSHQRGLTHARRIGASRFGRLISGPLAVVRDRLMGAIEQHFTEPVDMLGQQQH